MPNTNFNPSPRRANLGSGIHNYKAAFPIDVMLAIRQRAAMEGQTINAWLIRAARAALQLAPQPLPDFEPLTDFDDGPDDETNPLK